MTVGSEDNGASMAPKRGIVSSSHLVSERAAELSQFEYGLIMASNAFNRWTVRCMAAAGRYRLAVLLTSSRSGLR